MSAKLNRDEILKKAYEIWQSEGCPTGKDLEHWFMAETLVAAEKEVKPASKKKASSKKAAAKKTAAKKSPSKKSSAKKKATKAKT